MTLIEKLELQKDASPWGAAIDLCIKIVRDHRPWFPIDEAPVRTPIIAWAPGWVSPCEVWLDDNRVAYQAGSDCIPSPPPTDYQLMPAPPEAG